MNFKTGDKVRITKVGVDHLEKFENQIGDIISWIYKGGGEYKYKVMFDNECTAYFKDTELERIESDMDNRSENEGLHIKEFRSLEDIVEFLLDKYNLHQENQEQTSHNQEQDKNTYPPHIGDRVVVTEGDFKGIEGEIIAEVEAYNCYQIKVGELNAIYVYKDKVKITQRKEDTEKAKKIKELKLKIHFQKSKQKELEKELNLVDKKLDDLYKELEEMEE